MNQLSSALVNTDQSLEIPWLCKTRQPSIQWAAIQAIQCKKLLDKYIDSLPSNFCSSALIFALVFVGPDGSVEASFIPCTSYHSIMYLLEVSLQKDSGTFVFRAAGQDDGGCGTVKSGKSFLDYRPSPVVLEQYFSKCHQDDLKFTVHCCGVSPVSPLDNKTNAIEFAVLHPGRLAIANVIGDLAGSSSSSSAPANTAMIPSIDASLVSSMEQLDDVLERSQSSFVLQKTRRKPRKTLGDRIGTFFEMSNG